MKTCKECPAKIKDTNQCGTCRRCYWRIVARKRRGIDLDAPYTPRNKEVKNEGAPDVLKVCNECPVLLKPTNRSGMCKKHWLADYRRKKHPQREFNISIRSLASKSLSTYVPGPRYNYECPKCRFPYITNLPVDKSICPYCFVRGVASPVNADLSPSPSINQHSEIGTMNT